MHSANSSETPPVVGALQPANSPQLREPVYKLSVSAWAVAVVLQLAAIGGIVIRLTVQDSRTWAAPIYYALPWPVLMGLACLAGGWLFVCRRRLWAGCWTGVVAACGFACYDASFFQHQPTPSTQAVRTMLWNTHGGTLGWSRIAKQILRHDPEIVGLVEAGGRAAGRQQFWRRRFPEYTVSILGQGMVVLAKGPITQVESGLLSTGGRFRIVDVHIGQTRVRVGIVDIKSDPMAPRSIPLEKLEDVLARHADHPLLIMGDFNTPTDSVLLKQLRARFSNAFETAGNGYAATWPVPFPVLAIDQVWTNSQIQVHECRCDWSWCSDHRPVLTRVSLPTAPAFRLSREGVLSKSRQLD